MQSRHQERSRFLRLPQPRIWVHNKVCWFPSHVHPESAFLSDTLRPGWGHRKSHKVVGKQDRSDSHGREGWCGGPAPPSPQGPGLLLSCCSPMCGFCSLGHCVVADGHIRSSCHGHLSSQQEGGRAPSLGTLLGKLHTGLPPACFGQELVTRETAFQSRSNPKSAVLILSILLLALFQAMGVVYVDSLLPASWDVALPAVF